MNAKPNRATIPPNVLDAVSLRWPVGKSWGHNVEEELYGLCKNLGGTPVEVYEARYGFVVAVDTPSQRLVLRASADPGARQQAVTSRALATLGMAPRIHEVITTGIGTWTIMDRIVPGTPLADLQIDSRTLSALLLALFRPLLDQPAPDDTLPSISAWLRERLLDEHITDLAPGRTVASSSERKRALSVLNDLGDPVELCHGDTSTRNVLLNGPDRFSLVDPRGLNGEVTYDLAVLALKSGTSSQQIAQTFTRKLGVDSDRIAAWMVVARAARV